MAGNRIGGLKAKAKNLAFNPTFYKDIGRVGGSKPTDKLKGFAANRERASIVGRIGGLKSRRRKLTNSINDVIESGIVG